MVEKDKKEAGIPSNLNSLSNKRTFIFTNVKNPDNYIGKMFFIFGHD